jgi:methionyl-tRNA formyltransferase
VKRLAFMGSDRIALPLLNWLLQEGEGAELALVFTQPDRRSGRGMRLQANPIKQWAVAHSIDVLQPDRCGATEAGILKELGIDLVLVMAYGQLLKQDFLETPPLGCINFHASLLPQLRGPSPIHTAIAQQHRESGVSLMRIELKMDAGAVADQERVVIGPESTSEGLHTLLAGACVPLLQRNLKDLLAGEITFTEQEPSAVTYCRIITKEDSGLDFSRPASELAARIRAFQPWPGTQFSVGETRVRILAAEALDEPHSEQPGTVSAQGDLIGICCGEGILLPKQLQRPGGAPLSAADFLRGFPIAPGTVLSSEYPPPLEAAEPFRRKRE